MDNLNNQIPPQPAPPKETQVASTQPGQMPAEPLQVGQVPQPLPDAQDAKPAISIKRHLKFFSLMLFLGILLTGILYYRNNPLPGFIQSTADSLQDRFKSEQVYQSATTIEQSSGGSSTSEYQYSRESATRSQAVIIETTIIPAADSAVTQLNND